MSDGDNKVGTRRRSDVARDVDAMLSHRVDITKSSAREKGSIKRTAAGMTNTDSSAVFYNENELCSAIYLFYFRVVLPVVKMFKQKVLSKAVKSFFKPFYLNLFLCVSL